MRPLQQARPNINTKPVPAGPSTEIRIPHAVAGRYETWHNVLTPAPLRHADATKLRNAFGLLAHENGLTEVNVARDVERVGTVAAKIG